MIIKGQRAISNYSMMRNDLLQDTEVSWHAKGLWAYCMSLPPNWSINLSDLSNRSSNGLHATRSALVELEEHGYVERRRVQGGWVTILFETKQKTKQTLLPVGETVDLTDYPPCLNKYKPARRKLIYDLVKNYMEAQKENYPRVKINPVNLKKGIEEVEKAHRIDKFRIRDISKWLMFNTTDTTLFWSKNLMTLSTLRKVCADGCTKMEHIRDQYENVKGTSTGYDEPAQKTIELPPRFQKIKEHFPLKGTAYEIDVFLMSMSDAFNEFPEPIQELFKYNGGGSHFTGRYITWLAMMAPKSPHAKTVTGTDNKFWNQFIYKMEKENSMNFTTGRRK